MKSEESLLDLLLPLIFKTSTCPVNVYIPWQLSRFPCKLIYQWIQKLKCQPT